MSCANKYQNIKRTPFETWINLLYNEEEKRKEEIFGWGRGMHDANQFQEKKFSSQKNEKNTPSNEYIQRNLINGSYCLRKTFPTVSYKHFGWFEFVFLWVYFYILLFYRYEIFELSRLSPPFSRRPGRKSNFKANIIYFNHVIHILFL